MKNGSRQRPRTIRSIGSTAISPELVTAIAVQTSSADRCGSPQVVR